MTSKQTKPRAVTPHFVRELNQHVEKSWDTSGDGSADSELWKSETQAFLNNSTLKSLFYSEDWVFIIVDLIASKISSQSLKVMTSTIKGTETNTEELPEHPLNALIEQPNEWQDYSQWMYNTCVELFLMGNSIMWHAPRSGQLITLPAETITLQFDQKGAVSHYSMTQYSEEQGLREVVGRQDFLPKTICHVRRPNPNSLLWGMSPFIPGAKSLLFNRYSQDYLNAFYLKQATPGLALSLDRSVNEDVALRQLRSFEVAYQGRKNQRRTLILPKGVSATTLTHSLSDQNLLEHVQQNRETILGLLKVPKHELSLQSAGSLGSEEYKIALRNFWESTLKPGMRFIEGSLTKFFQKELGPDAFFQFDISEVEALKDDLKKKADTAIAMLQGGLTVNEVRQQIWKQEASLVSGSDEPYVLISKAPTFGAPSFPPAASTPPPVETPPVEESQKLLPSSMKITFTPEIEASRARMTKQLLDEEDTTITDLAKAAVELLVDMTEKAIEVLASSDKSMWLMDYKELPSKRVLTKRLLKALTENFEETWQNEIAKTLKKSLDLGYNQQLELVFNEKDRAAIEALRARDSEKRRLILAARGIESFDQISKTHTERIMKEVTEGQTLGESITNIMRRVANALGIPGQLAGKAETIARTETLTAVSLGQAAALKNAKEVIPGLKKVWLTAGDDRVRDSHAELNGDVVDASAKFSNGLDHPRDVNSGDPSEVINCRCTLLIVPPGEKLEIPK